MRRLTKRLGKFQAAAVLACASHAREYGRGRSRFFFFFPLVSRLGDSAGDTALTLASGLELAMALACRGVGRGRGREDGATVCGANRGWSTYTTCAPGVGVIEAVVARSTYSWRESWTCAHVGGEGVVRCMGRAQRWGRSQRDSEAELTSALRACARASMEAASACAAWPVVTVGARSAPVPRGALARRGGCDRGHAERRRLVARRAARERRDGAASAWKTEHGAACSRHGRTLLLSSPACTCVPLGLSGVALARRDRTVPRPPRLLSSAHAQRRPRVIYNTQHAVAARQPPCVNAK